MALSIRILATFLIGSLFFVVFPILAWGVLDINGFISNTARLSYLLTACALNAFAAFRIPEVGKKSPGHKVRSDRQHLTVVLLQAITTTMVLVLPYCDRHELGVFAESPAIRFPGLLLYSFGFLVMHFAQSYLGDQFSVEVGVREGHRLVTDGPYKIIRHPRYLGIILFVIGIAMVFRSWLGVLIAVATIVVLLWRMRDEEALMHQEFGLEWERYARRTHRLIPHLW
jgi:protein-S-isoprenylcysteine O-methyltransferase Ste14